MAHSEPARPPTISGVGITAPRAHLDELFECAPDAIFIINEDGQWTDINHTGCALLGLARSEVIGKRVVDFIAREDLENFATFRSRTHSGATHTSECHLRRNDGSLVPVEVTARATSHGTLQCFVRNTTERLVRDAEKQEWSAIVEGISIAPDAVISTDNELRVAIYNNGAERIFGWTRDEMLGKPIERLFPERFRNIHRIHVDKFQASGPTARRMAGDRSPIVGLRKNGEEFPAQASISHTYVGNAHRFTVILRDITLEQQMLKTAQDATRAREVLLGVVAHDLRSPISAASLTLDRLLTSSQPLSADRVQSATRRVARSLRRASRIIDDLLDAAILDGDGMVVEKSAVEIETLIEEAIAEALPLADDAGVSLSYDIPYSLPKVSVDGSRMSRVFSNLIGNAVKFSHRGGRIVVSALATPHHIRVSVSDTGCGIPASAIPRIFDRYWQSSPGTQGGAGLGLWIVKGIISAHGGDIWVESIPGTGSEFIFTLPLDG